jgi:hypothetical protein
VVQRRGTWRYGPPIALAHARALRAAGGAQRAADVRAALDHVEETARRVGAPNYIPLATQERAALAELEGDAGARQTYLQTALREFERIGAAFRAGQIRRLLAESSSR